MAKGFQANEDHKAALAALGRSLARRARSRCELCETGGQALAPWEVPPAPPDPDEDRCLFVCERCRRVLDGASLDPNEWRFLEGVVWSELPPVQVTAVRLLRRLAADGVDWAADAVDGVVIDEEIAAWVEQAS